MNPKELKSKLWLIYDTLEICLNEGYRVSAEMIDGDEFEQRLDSALYLVGIAINHVNQEYFLEEIEANQKP